MNFDLSENKHRTTTDTMWICVPEHQPSKCYSNPIGKITHNSFINHTHTWFGTKSSSQYSWYSKILFCFSFISILKFFEKHSFTGVIIDGWNNFLVAFFIFRFTSTHIKNKNMRERFCLVFRINSTCRKVPLKGDRSLLKIIEIILVNWS